MKGKFYFFVFFYFFLMIIDGLCTYIGTPDLKMEANPLVSVMGLGWTSLFIANFAALTLYIIITHYTYVKYIPPKINEKKITRYLSQLFFYRPDKFSWTFYRLPKNWRPFWALLGYAFSWSLPLSRIFTVAEWIFVLMGIDAVGYNRIRELFPKHRLDVAVAGIIAIITSCAWVLLQYKKNKKLLSQESFT